MGIDPNSFPSISSKCKVALRNSHNFSEKDFILIYVAEFSKRKNQKFLINSMNKLISEGFSNIKLLFLGDGQFLDELKLYSQSLSINDNVFFCWLY